MTDLRTTLKQVLDAERREGHVIATPVSDQHLVILTVKNRDTDEHSNIRYLIDAPTPWQAIDAAVAQWHTTEHDLDVAGVPGHYTLVGNRVAHTWKRR